MERNPKNVGWGLEKDGSASVQRVETSLGMDEGVVSLWVRLREVLPLPFLTSLRVTSGELPREPRFYPSAPEERLVL